MIIDRMTNRDTDIDTLVEFATATLITTLRAAPRVDPSVRFAPEIVTALEEFSVKNRPPKNTSVPRRRRAQR